MIEIFFVKRCLVSERKNEERMIISTSREEIQCALASFEAPCATSKRILNECTRLRLSRPTSVRKASSESDVHAVPVDVDPEPCDSPSLSADGSYPNLAFQGDEVTDPGEKA